jgi:hypothetical protein
MKGILYLDETIEDILETIEEKIFYIFNVAEIC